MKRQRGEQRILLLTVDQAADRLSCSKANVYALIEQGELPVVRIGRAKGYRVDIRDLGNFVRDRKFRFAIPSARPASVKLKHMKL
jgi:excisionase family DNA binding protein